MSARILITGSGTGLGLETALYLAARGYEVYAAVLTPDQQQHAQAEAAAQGVTLHTPLFDVTDAMSIAAALDPILAAGALDGVVHYAGISLRGYFEDCDDDEIRRVLEVNLFGAMNVTRAVLPAMRQARRGRLIFVSSIGGRIASMARTAYCASKFALEGFAESLYQEVLPFNIQVSIVEPAIIRTERWTVHRGLARRAAAAESPYRAWFEQQEALADALVSSSPTRPVDVAAQVHTLLTTPRPALRSVVGRRANLVVTLRKLLPGELFERLYFGEAVKRVTQAGPKALTQPEPTR
jgi:NAD(P)-dependent dehydrogenase (short-subunit alcohol dehydrogenase family)